MDVWKGCWGTFAELSCKHTLQILSCTHSTHTAALTLSALYVITASLQTTVGVCYCCLMSRWWTRVRVLELLLVSATAAAPSHYTAWSPPYWRHSAGGKQPSAFQPHQPAALQSVYPLQSVSSVYPHCSTAAWPRPAAVPRLLWGDCACADHALHSTAAGLCCRAPWDTTATTVMLSPLDRV